MAARIRNAGERVFVYDPAPRVPISNGQRLERLTSDDGPFDLVLSSVPPTVAEQVPALVAPVVANGSLLLDWNTVSPETKQAIASASACEVLDVALLDTLDSDGDRPRLAISGQRADAHRPLLESLGFYVDIAGSAPGDAALLKYARSIFMKSLEGLFLEYVALTQPIDQQGIVAGSVENNLGNKAMEFLNLLVVTNRRHAARRAHELADAVAVFGTRGASIDVAKAVVPLLQRAAQLWQRPDAPGEGASLAQLSAFLEKHL